MNPLGSSLSSPVTLATTFTPTPLCGHLSYRTQSYGSAGTQRVWPRKAGPWSAGWRGRGAPARALTTAPASPGRAAPRPLQGTRTIARARRRELRSPAGCPGGGTSGRTVRPGTPPAADLAQPLSAANPVPGEPAWPGLVAVPGRAVPCRDAPGSDPRLRSVAS